MIIWGDADETMLQEKDHMSDRNDKLREAIRTIREHSVSYGPRDTTIRVALMEGTVHEILGAATRSLEMPSLPHPDSLDSKALFAMWEAGFAGDRIGREAQLRAAYKGLYDHLTEPKTKIVNVIEGAGRSTPPYTRTYETDDKALMHAYIDAIRMQGYGLINITTKEVPA